MSKVVPEPTYLKQLAQLDAQILELNSQKIELIFELLGICPKDHVLKLMLEWDLILVTVKDKQMAVQLNKLSAYVPNLKFIVEPDAPLFKLYPGENKRRVWKER
jgi:hypothetical protein